MSGTSTRCPWRRRHLAQAALYILKHREWRIADGEFDRHSQRTQNLVGCFTHCAHLIAPLSSVLPLQHPTGVSHVYVYALYLSTPSARKQCGHSLKYSEQLTHHKGELAMKRRIGLEEHMSHSKATGIPSVPYWHRSSNGAALQASGRNAKHEARRAGQNHADTHQRPDHPQ